MSILACPSRLLVVTLLAAFGLAAAGCINVAPERDARGNPRIERMTSEQLARLEQRPAPRASIGADEILRLSREGRTAEQIIEILRDGGVPPRLTREQRNALAAQGLSAPVLDWLSDADRRAAQTDAIDAQVRRETAEGQDRAADEARARELEMRKRRHDPFYGDPFYHFSGPAWPAYWGWRWNYPPRHGVGIFWRRR